MVDRELVRRQTTSNCTGEFVYSVASSAAVLLQGMGEYCLVGRGRFNGKEADRSVHHAIGLNEIHLSVLRSGLLVRWIGSMEVRSQNELTGFGFAKDYDAVVTVRTEAGEQRFALEYERSPKPMRYYRDVAATLSREAHVKDWHSQLLDMPVSCSSATRCFRFRETLNDAAPRVEAAAISA